MNPHTVAFLMHLIKLESDNSSHVYLLWFSNAVCLSSWYCLSNLAMASLMGAFSISAIITSSWAILQSNGVVGVRWVASQLDTFGQLTLKKWLEPHRMRSPLWSFTFSVISHPLTQVLADGNGVMKSSKFSISSTQCWVWIPNPINWMSCSVSALARPTNVRSFRQGEKRIFFWNIPEQNGWLKTIVGNLYPSSTT